MAEVYATVGKVAWASLPLRVGERVLGSLTASWDEPQTFTPDEVELMSAFAAQCAQALDRMLVRHTERHAATATRRLAEALQRSLLTEPPPVDHLQIAVRYLPAAAEAQVGGDWYDAFHVCGTLSLAIGDVAGHDQDATALMGQVRNMLRGGGTHEQGQSVGGADRPGLGHGGPDRRRPGHSRPGPRRAEPVRRRLRRHRLRWSSAGHLPPVLLGPEGTTGLLSRRPDLLMGVDPDTDRADHEHVLPPSSTVLFYTDGMVERRGSPLNHGLRWLQDAVARCADLELHDLCDALLAELSDELEDDVALLAVRVEPR
jgi:serine phosphatase RsbU (regulator of sigma subunit)